MKRKTTFLAKAFTMLFAVLFSLATSGAAAQETLTVYEDGTATSAYVPVYGFYGDAFNKCEFIIPSDELATMINGTISQMTFYLSSPAAESWGDAQFQVFLKEVNETTLDTYYGAEGATIVYEGALDGTGETMTIDFTSSYTYGGNNLLVGVYQTVTGAYKSASFYGVTAAGASITGYNYSSLDAITTANARDFIPKTTFAYTGGSFDGVHKPTGLKVSYEGGTEATISWSSEEEAFDIDVNGTVTENVENPTTLTGLEYATVYTIKVRAKRGEEVSDWSNPVTFNTDISDDMCQIKLVLTDSYGDGWNGNAIQITDVLSGIVIGTYANQNLDGQNGEETQTIYVDVPNGRDIRFTWVVGSYATETSYAAYDINEEVIFSGSGEALPTTTWHVNCAASPWRSPADLAASEITAFSAKLSWTERSLTPATSWVLAYAAAGAAEYTEVTVTENPYVLEGLTPETTYAVKVRPATDEVEFWSDEITFTTDVQFPAVQDLAATDISATSATIAWTEAEGATSYVLEYAEGGMVTYQYDNGTPASALGITADFSCAVMFPAGSFTGNTLSNVNLYDLSAAEGVVSIYSGGDAEPEGTALASENVTFTGAEAPVVVNINATIDPTQNVWVVINFPSGGYYAVANDELGDANGRWSNLGSGWVDLSSVGGSGYCWMIGAEIGSEASAWTTIEGATSPVELTGLNPETIYTVRVKAIYEDGESVWTSTSFITAEEVATPTDLAVSEVGNKSAVLSWTENGEATAWQIALNGDEANLIAADSNPFTLTGLTPETAYTAKVRAINGEKQSKWSKEVSFTTDIAFAAPAELAAEAASTDATITWTGDADSYNLRYRVYVPGNELTQGFDDGSLGEWTTIDADGDGYDWVLGSATNGIYLQGNMTDNGPAGYDGSQDLITSGSYSNITGALTPDNYLVSPKVKLGGSITFYACAQDAGYAAEHFGVAVSTTGNTDAADFTTIEEWTMTSEGTPASSRRKDRGTWGLFTVDLSAYAGQEGYVAIRHFNCSDFFLLNVDDITITMPGEGEEQPWVVVENATSPYTIEGLDEDTKYEVAVQAVYADGESQWATTTFTTLNNNPVPYDIVADLKADGANLSWKGSGEDYVVRYRNAGAAAASSEATFFEDFEGLEEGALPEGWTTVDSDGDGNTWSTHTNTGTGNYNTHGGDGVAISASYIDAALTPDNWLITPKLDLGGTMRVWLCGQDASWAGEHFAIYLAPVAEIADVSDFTITLVPETVTTGDYTEYTADLSAYAGQQGYIAIRHFNITDMFWLDLDDFGLYGESEEPWTEIYVNMGDTEATISGLATNNTYEYQIKSIKGEEETEWSPLGEFSLVTLDCNESNEELLDQFNGKFAHVTLANRTLYKDGTWNTLCLPFGLSEEEFNNTVLADGELRTLTDLDYDEENDIVTLNFEEAMGAFGSSYPDFVGGVPYIIKWTAGGEVVNPEFANVTISKTAYYLTGTTSDESIAVHFISTFDWMEFPDTDQSSLFLGADNTLYYPESGASVAATRCYFELEGVTAGDGEGVKFFTNLDGANDPTGIANISVKDSGDWYDISGRKIAGKPVQKGIYVNGGRKVTVK